MPQFDEPEPPFPQDSQLERCGDDPMTCTTTFAELIMWLAWAARVIEDRHGVPADETSDLIMNRVRLEEHDGVLKVVAYGQVTKDDGTVAMEPIDFIGNAIGIRDERIASGSDQSCTIQKLIRSYLWTMATTCGRSAGRRMHNKRREHADDLANLPDNSPKGEVENRLQFEEYLNRLPSKLHQDVVRFYVLDDYSQSQIGEMLGLSRDSVQGLWEEAKKILRPFVSRESAGLTPAR